MKTETARYLAITIIIVTACVSGVYAIIHSQEKEINLYKKENKMLYRLDSLRTISDYQDHQIELLKNSK